MFDIFVSELDGGGRVPIHSSGTALRGPADLLKGGAAVHRDAVCRSEGAGGLWESTRMVGIKTL